MLRRLSRKVAPGGRDSAMGPASAPADDASPFDKAELKAMIERKRRNDFVRKRELDMLRRIRREGLTPEQAASLTVTDQFDDSDNAKLSLPPSRMDSNVKEKIDAIEQQMVGGVSGLQRLAKGPRGPMTEPPTLTQTVLPEQTAGRRSRGAAPKTLDDAVVLTFDEPEVARSPALDVKVPDTPWNGSAQQPDSLRLADTVEPAAPIARPAAVPPPASASASAPVAAASSAAAPAAPAAPTASSAPLAAVEVSEVAHDHELDEAVISFANADYNHCERLLGTLVAAGGSRENEPETWRVLLDYYRATGNGEAFDRRAAEFTGRFQMSSPQWLSLPSMVAEATTSRLEAERASSGDVGSELKADFGWVCPPHLTEEEVSRLSAQTMQLPSPWLLDWSAVQRVDVDAAVRLRQLFASWTQRPLEMQWPGADRLMAALNESAPVGSRSADPAYWLLRLEALRLVNRPDQFDEVAIDYCVTYEVSPPSWEASQASARVGAGSAPSGVTRSAAMSMMSDPVTSVFEGSAFGDSVGNVVVTSMELCGQLSGDIGDVLKHLEDAVDPSSTVLRISCALLIRVDFIAAGDLLNWVLVKRSNHIHVTFTDTHRLVALMFRAMGITEHARVELRLS